MKVTISNGSYRGVEVNGEFDAVEAHKLTPTNILQIRVKGDGVSIPSGVIARVKVNSVSDIVYLEGAVGESDLVPANVDVVKEFTSSESDEEAMVRIRDTFDILTEATNAVVSGTIRGMIISGPAGVGKSFGVEEVLKKYEMCSRLSFENHPEMYAVVKGSASPIGLYQILWRFASKGQVLVFDDCDSILFDDVSLNLLKAALDSSDKRHISWNAESRVLDEAGIPNRFEFKGSIIFLTNLNFEQVRGRNADHLKALMSRVHYLDMEMASTRDKLLRVKQVVGDGMLQSYDFSQEEEQEVIDYVIDNHKYLRELSLRTVKKVADLRKSMPARWTQLAEMTVLTREAKFARMLDEKKKKAALNA